MKASKSESKQDEGNVFADLKAGKAQQWNKTRQRMLLRFIAAAIYRDEELRGPSLAKGFKRLVPDYERHFTAPVSDKSIISRGYNAWRSETESPERDEANAPLWTLARALVKGGRPVDIDAELEALG